MCPGSVTVRTAGLRVSAKIVHPRYDSPVLLTDQPITSIETKHGEPGKLTFRMSGGPIAALALVRIDGQVTVVAEFRESRQPGLVLTENVTSDTFPEGMSLLKVCLMWAFAVA